MNRDQAIKVDGAKELRKRLKAIEGGTAELKQAHAEAGTIVEQQARQIVPFREGVLMGSIRSSGQAAAAVVRAGSSRVKHAGPIHFGWAARNISPQPFLYDALDARHDEVVDTYQRQVDRIIETNGLA